MIDVFAMIILELTQMLPKVFLIWQHFSIDQGNKTPTGTEVISLSGRVKTKVTSLLDSTCRDCSLCNNQHLILLRDSLYVFDTYFKIQSNLRLRPHLLSDHNLACLASPCLALPRLASP